MTLLVQKYRDPDRAGLVNYVNLANDLDATAAVTDAERRTQFDVVRDMGDYLPRQMRPDQPLQDVMDRIRVRRTVSLHRRHHTYIHIHTNLYSAKIVERI